MDIHNLMRNTPRGAQICGKWVFFRLDLLPIFRCAISQSSECFLIKKYENRRDLIVDCRLNFYFLAIF